MKKIYLSLPITGKDMVAQRRLANLWQKYLESRGYGVINPFELYDALAKDMYPVEPTYEEIMRVDLWWLRNSSDEIIFIDGWFDSSGCMRELELTIECGIYPHIDKNFKLQ
jgi:hypothetical protein